VTPPPDVSGFTRNEKFIMESLASLQATATDVRDRVSKLEARIDTLERAQQSASQPGHLQNKLLEGRTQIWLAIVGGIFTFLSSVTALVISLLAKKS
jgi:uncharacterized protein YlxW (UPF0749 family)